MCQSTDQLEYCSLQTNEWVGTGNMDLKNIIDKKVRSALDAIQAMIDEKDTARIHEYLVSFGEILLFYRKNWSLNLDWAYGEVINILKDPSDFMVAAALDGEYRSLFKSAEKFACMASLINPAHHYKVMAASYCRKNGNIEKARMDCLKIVETFPGNQSALSELFMCDIAERFWPTDYYDLIAEIHCKCPPRVYLEIGVAAGRSLALARSNTRALGIDPTAERGSLVYISPENDPQLYKMTSNDFFANQNVIKEMGQSYFDVAFIDGLHHFDQVLRDFINLERFAGPDSIILIHDCLPINARVAARDRSTWFWTGDVWKAIPCLLAVRPDLEIVTLPASPSGIALIRRLDPSSHILERQYDSLVQHFAALELPEDWHERCTMLNVQMDQAAFNLADFLPPKGWL